ncbi:pilus assembly protein TadG-related protein [Arthrobacter sp. SDTb3-6]|uniref:pilus assembly protein TadG-related protein n=1 Tax=Arthrobacter sp. SDTb3-6 TaxID=2713571 RepID=UPI002108AB39|nr:pilus assembly protein TadG-related protein [Arthrobacter sp. SDTb3-6]
MMPDGIQNERGAVAVIVALSMVVLLGATAFSLDVGAMYAERSQLQNGADAAAIAIAQNCAAGSCGDTTTTAQNLANSNANDGASNVGAIDFPTSTSVHVMTTTKDAATGAGSLALSFAPVLGIRNKTVAADATAGWGYPASGPDALALAFAPCVFNPNGTIQVITLSGSGGSKCSSTSPSGQVLPGGFGWLADPTGTCNANVSITSNAPVSGNTGVSISAPCAASLSNLANKTVLLPVYSDIGGTGTGAWYVIRGWAAFKVLGWNFTGPTTNYNNNTYPGATCQNTCKGLIGQFISFVSLDTNFTTGGPNLGAALVTLTK